MIPSYLIGSEIEGTYRQMDGQTTRQSTFQNMLKNFLGSQESEFDKESKSGFFFVGGGGGGGRYKAKSLNHEIYVTGRSK